MPAASSAALATRAALAPMAAALAALALAVMATVAAAQIPDSSAVSGRFISDLRKSNRGHNKIPTINRPPQYLEAAQLPGFKINESISNFVHDILNLSESSPPSSENDSTNGQFSSRVGTFSEESLYQETPQEDNNEYPWLKPVTDEHLDNIEIKKRVSPNTELPFRLTNPSSFTIPFRFTIPPSRAKVTLQPDEELLLTSLNLQLKDNSNLNQHFTPATALDSGSPDKHAIFLTADFFAPGQLKGTPQDLLDATSKVISGSEGHRQWSTPRSAGGSRNSTLYPSSKYDLTAGEASSVSAIISLLSQNNDGGPNTKQGEIKLLEQLPTAPPFHHLTDVPLSGSALEVAIVSLSKENSTTTTATVNQPRLSSKYSYLPLKELYQSAIASNSTVSPQSTNVAHIVTFSTPPTSSYLHLKEQFKISTIAPNIQSSTSETLPPDSTTSGSSQNDNLQHYFSSSEMSQIISNFLEIAFDQGFTKDEYGTNISSLDDSSSTLYPTEQISTPGITSESIFSETLLPFETSQYENSSVESESEDYSEYSGTPPSQSTFSYLHLKEKFKEQVGYSSSIGMNDNLGITSQGKTTPSSYLPLKEKYKNSTPLLQTSTISTPYSSTATNKYENNETQTVPSSSSDTMGTFFDMPLSHSTNTGSPLFGSHVLSTMTHPFKSSPTKYPNTSPPYFTNPSDLGILNTVTETIHHSFITSPEAPSTDLNIDLSLQEGMNQEPDDTEEFSSDSTSSSSISDVTNYEITPSNIKNSTETDLPHKSLPEATEVNMTETLPNTQFEIHTDMGNEIQSSVLPISFTENESSTDYSLETAAISTDSPLATAAISTDYLLETTAISTDYPFTTAAISTDYYHATAAISSDNPFATDAISTDYSLATAAVSTDYPHEAAHTGTPLLFQTETNSPIEGPNVDPFETNLQPISSSYLNVKEKHRVAINSNSSGNSSKPIGNGNFNHNKTTPSSYLFLKDKYKLSTISEPLLALKPDSGSSTISHESTGIETESPFTGHSNISSSTNNIFEANTENPFFEDFTVAYDMDSSSEFNIQALIFHIETTDSILPEDIETLTSTPDTSAISVSENTTNTGSSLLETVNTGSSIADLTSMSIPLNEGNFSATSLILGHPSTQYSALKPVTLHESATSVTNKFEDSFSTPETPTPNTITDEVFSLVTTLSEMNNLQDTFSETSLTDNTKHQTTFLTSTVTPETIPWNPESNKTIVNVINPPDFFAIAAHTTENDSIATEFLEATIKVPIPVGNTSPSPNNLSTNDNLEVTSEQANANVTLFSYLPLKEKYIASLNDIQPYVIPQVSSNAYNTNFITTDSRIIPQATLQPVTDIPTSSIHFSYLPLKDKHKLTLNNSSLVSVQTNGVVNEAIFETFSVGDLETDLAKNVPYFPTATSSISDLDINENYKAGLNESDGPSSFPLESADLSLVSEISSVGNHFESLRVTASPQMAATTFILPFLNLTEEKITSANNYSSVNLKPTNMRDKSTTRKYSATYIPLKDRIINDLINVNLKKKKKNSNRYQESTTVRQTPSSEEFIRTDSRISNKLTTLRNYMRSNPNNTNRAVTSSSVQNMNEDDDAYFIPLSMKSNFNLQHDDTVSISPYIPLQENFGSLLSDIESDPTLLNELDTNNLFLDVTPKPTTAFSYLRLKDKYKTTSTPGFIFITPIDTNDGGNTTGTSTASEAPINSFLGLKDKHQSFVAPGQMTSPIPIVDLLMGTMANHAFVFRVDEENEITGSNSTEMILDGFEYHINNISSSTFMPSFEIGEQFEQMTRSSLTDHYFTPSNRHSNSSAESPATTPATFKLMLTEAVSHNASSSYSYSSNNPFKPNYDILQQLSAIVRDVQRVGDQSSSVAPEYLDKPNQYLSKFPSNFVPQPTSNSTNPSYNDTAAMSSPSSHQAAPVESQSHLLSNYQQQVAELMYEKEKTKIKNSTHVLQQMEQQHQDISRPTALKIQQNAEINTEGSLTSTWLTSPTEANTRMASSSFVYIDEFRNDVENDTEYPLTTLAQFNSMSSSAAVLGSILSSAAVFGSIPSSIAEANPVQNPAKINSLRDSLVAMTPFPSGPAIFTPFPSIAAITPFPSSQAVFSPTPNNLAVFTPFQSSPAAITPFPGDHISSLGSSFARRASEHDRECLDPAVRYACGTCAAAVMCLGTQAFAYDCVYPKSSCQKDAIFGAECKPGLASECDCSPGQTRKPDPYDPSSFISCSATQAITVDYCVEHEHYSPTESQCIPEPASPSCTALGSYSNPNDCQWYFCCLWPPGNGNFQKVSIRCSNDQVFSMTDRVCKDTSDLTDSDVCKSGTMSVPRLDNNVFTSRPLTQMSSTRVTSTSKSTTTKPHTRTTAAVVLRTPITPAVRTSTQAAVLIPTPSTPAVRSPAQAAVLNPTPSNPAVRSPVQAVVLSQTPDLRSPAQVSVLGFGSFPSSLTTTAASSEISKPTVPKQYTCPIVVVLVVYWFPGVIDYACSAI